MKESQITYQPSKDVKIQNDYHLNYAFPSPLIFNDINLLQVGRMFCNETSAIYSHLHSNFYELTIIADGKGTIITNNIRTNVQQGDIYLSFPYDTHEIISSKAEPLKFNHIAFSISNDEILNNLREIQVYFNSPKLRCFKDENILPLIEHIITELNENGLFCKQAMSSSLSLMLIYTIRNFFFSKSTLKKNVSNKDVLCYKVMNYIDTHLMTLKNLKQLAEKFNYNYNYLSEIFKNTTNVSLTDYFTRKKFDYAKQLIIDGKKVYEVANILNYSNQYTFSKGFKIHFGTSPKQLQLQYAPQRTPPPKKNHAETRFY